MKKILSILLVLSLWLSLGSFALADAGELIVYTSMPLNVADTIIAGFMEQTGIKVEMVVASGGELMARIEAEADNPLGDVMMSGTISNVTARQHLFDDYVTANEEHVLDNMKNSEGPLTRFDIIGSVLIVNNKLAEGIEIKGYADLLQPELKGKIAMADPNKSSSAWEHVVNMLYGLGDGDPEQGWDYAAAFSEQLDGKLLGSSSAVYKGVTDGEYTVGLTSEGSAANQVAAGADVSIVYMEEGIILRGDGVYIIKNAKNLENAQKFLDYCTDYDTQLMMNNDLFCRSVRSDIPASETLPSTSELTIIDAPEEEASANKVEWLNRFTDIYIDMQ